MSVPWMSDNRFSVTDSRPLCKCPVGGVLPPAGRFRLWGGVFSLAGCAAISWVEGKGRFRGWCCWFVER